MMRRLVWWLTVLLVFGPILGLVGAGGYLLWDKGWLRWLWWGLLIAWGLAAACWSWYGMLARPKPVLPHLRTPLDEEAWPVVVRYAERVDGILRDNPEKLLTFTPYTDAAQDLARELAPIYHPKARGSYDNLSVLEVIAAAELVLGDVARLVEKTMLSSRWLTMGRLRQIAGSPDAYRQVSSGWTIAYALYDLPRAAIGYLLGRYGGSSLLKRLQDNVLGYLYVQYIYQLGFYLIELYSGRLKGGAGAYRRLTERWQPTAGDGQPEEAAPQPPTPPAPEEDHLTIAVAGQLKAGKSSLVNALLGEQKAAADALPATDRILGYRLRSEELAETLLLLDTPGYGGPATTEQLEETMEAVRKSAMTLVVLHAVQGAREPDLVFLRQMDSWFRSRPEFRRPPLLGVLTHIDQLRPVREWEPPYDGWMEDNPPRPKERSIHEAVDFVRGYFQPLLDAGVIPVCIDVAGGRVYGVDEWLLPALANLLPQARAKRLVDLLRAAGKGKGVGDFFRRVVETGKLLAKLGIGVWQASAAPAPPTPPAAGESRQP
jgi:predicted GTPase